MSQNENEEQMFEHWLTETLQTPSAGPAFAQNLTRKMQRLHARRVLRKVLLQKRLAAFAFFALPAILIGLLFYPPVLDLVYTQLKAFFTGMLTALINPEPVYLTVPAAALLVLFFLCRSLWRSLSTDI